MATQVSAEFVYLVVPIVAMVLVSLQEFSYKRASLYADHAISEWAILLFNYGTLAIFGPAFLLQLLALFGVAVHLNVDYW